MGRMIETLLVIDDDELQLQSARRSCGRDRTVLTAANASDGVALAIDARPDLALVDLMLDGRASLPMIEELAATVPETTIVVMSGHLTIAMTEAAMRAGAARVVEKPVTYRAVLRHFEQGAPLHDLDQVRTLEQVERDHVVRVFEVAQRNLTRAARLLGIPRATLRRKLRQHGYLRRGLAPDA